MAIDFPASPTNGQTFTSGALVYTYDGTKWTAQPAGVTGGTKIEVGNTKAEIVDTGSDGRFVVTTEGTERARIDSSGRLGIGATTPNKLVELRSTDAATTLRISNRYNSNSGAAVIDFETLYGGVDGAYGYAEIGAVRDGTSTNYMYFKTSGSERMRLNNTGTLSVYGPADNPSVNFSVSHGPGSHQSLAIYSGGSSTTSLGTKQFFVQNNGDVRNTNNSYGSISDLKLKENIVDANSQWNDLKALQVRNYNFKEETGHQGHTQIGLVAQEAELVSPGLVSESSDRDEDGNDLGTVTKSVNYSVLYMKAVKALQEAMERIETLEAKVAALEAQ
jgi:hypothetical protein